MSVSVGEGDGGKELQRQRNGYKFCKIPSKFRVYLKERIKWFFAVFFSKIIFIRENKMYKECMHFVRSWQEQV